MKVQVSINPKSPSRGLGLDFPYSAQYVDHVKQILGVKWDKAHKLWVSEGPEILLDMQRFGIGVERISPEARRIAEQFRDELWRLSEIRARPYENFLYSFQKIGSEWLQEQKAALLADEMGIGKTKQVLDALAQLDIENVLVVCPNAVTYNWLMEVHKWHPWMEAEVVPQDPRERSLFWKDRPLPRVIITNYEKLRLGDWPKEVIRWDAVVFDEANILKNSGTLVYGAARTQARRSKRVWFLTGTPLEIRIEELYNMFSILRPAVLGSFRRFEAQHIEKDWKGDFVRLRNPDVLRERIGPWMLRRTKDEVLPYLPQKLPPIPFQIKMSPAEDKAYDMIFKDFEDWLKQQGRVGQDFRVLRLQQFCCSPKIFNDPTCGRGTKYEALLQILKDWPGRVLVFCYFEEMTKLLRQWLRTDIPADYNWDAYISGNTKAKRRTELQDLFNDGKLGRVFISTDAGAKGLNFTGADLIIHYSQLWNPQVMHQREDRLHRIGQTRPVQVMHLLYADSIDMGMYSVNRGREKLAHDVVDGSEEAMARKLNPARLLLLARGQVA